MKLAIILFVAYICIFPSANTIECLRNYCDDIICKKVVCGADQILVQQGSYCGCCPACYTILGVGEQCEMTNLDFPVYSICIAGTECRYDNHHRGPFCLQKRYKK